VGSIIAGASKMAKNTGKGFRVGPVDDRSQTFNPNTSQFVKRDADTGKFIDVKQDGTPFKGVRKER
jgi:hypothetical protein